MCQKRQISLPVGYETATPKTGDWERFDVNSGFQVKPREKQISQSLSYCELINLLRNGTIVRCLWENKKTLEKSVFREAWSPELTSQSFPVPCFWSRGFVPHRKWNLMLLVRQNTGKENRYGKNFFAVLISTLGRFDRANKKNICHIHFKVVWYPKIWWCSWKIQFLANTRFKTLEHLSKTFWNDLAKFSSWWVRNLRKVRSGICFFYLATAIATAVYHKHVTKNMD